MTCILRYTRTKSVPCLTRERKQGGLQRRINSINSDLQRRISFINPGLQRRISFINPGSTSQELHKPAKGRRLSKVEKNSLREAGYNNRKTSISKSKSIPIVDHRPESRLKVSEPCVKEIEETEEEREKVIRNIPVSTSRSYLSFRAALLKSKLNEPMKSTCAVIETARVNSLHFTRRNIGIQQFRTVRRTTSRSDESSSSDDEAGALEALEALGHAGTSFGQKRHPDVWTVKYVYPNKAFEV